MRSTPRAILLSAPLVMALSALLNAQVTIQKNGIEVPEQRVDLLFRTTCHVMTEEFHLDNACKSFPVTLVLGDPNERVSGDELNQVYFIYLNRWDDALFATSASRIILQHIVSKERKTKIVTEILRRVDQMGPVSRQSLLGQTAFRK